MPAFFHLVYQVVLELDLLDIYIRIVPALSLLLSAIISLVLTPFNLCPFWTQVKSFRCPCDFNASNLYLNAHAFSDGSIVSRC